MTPDERVEALTARVVAKLDREALAKVAAKYGDGATSGPSASKYLDADRWIRVCARRAVALGLDLDRGRSILDLGTGAGYFPLVCRELGHDVLGTDMPIREALYADLTPILGIDVLPRGVLPMRPLLPSPHEPFDLITAFMVTFNGHRVRPWGVDKWAFFLDDAMARLMPGGRLVLELNAEPDGRCYDSALRELFVDRGAVITGHWPHPPRANGHRLVFARG